MTIDSIVDTIYITFAHNQYAIAFFIGILLSIVSLLIKPSRSKVFLLIGFTVLLIGFEYDKHIMEPLMEQTLASLGSDNPASRSSQLLVRTFQKILPFGSFTIGWGSIFTSVFFQTLFRKRPEN